MNDAHVLQSLQVQKDHKYFFCIPLNRTGHKIQVQGAEFAFVMFVFVVVAQLKLIIHPW
jgi:hypothetical protein